MKVSIFDLDHTLIKVNSSFRFGLYLYRKKILSFSRMLALLINYGRHKLRLLSVEELHTKAAETFFSGQNLAQLNPVIQDFLTHELTQMIDPLVYLKLQEAKKKGDEVIVLSSSPDFLVGPIAGILGADRFGATKYEVDEDGCICGVSHQMGGKDKAAFVKRLNIPKKDLIAYTDSHHDIPLLEVVGQPVAVNPNRLLKKACQLRNWQILQTAKSGKI